VPGMTRYPPARFAPDLTLDALAAGDIGKGQPFPGDEPAPAAVVDTTDASAVVDAIMASRGLPFGRYLMAAVRRLGQLGREGRHQVERCRDMGQLGETFSRGALLAGTIALGELAGRKPSEPAEGLDQ
jgi:hypothetical protein